MPPTQPQALDSQKIAELARFYPKHLLDDVMSFWEPRTRDHECGGYLTCFDRTGKLTDTDKYIWFQGRQLWTFSALYRQLEPRDAWLELARVGRDFLVAHAYAGRGRWNYHLDRQGRLKQGTISLFTDLFVLAGLCEYALATGSDADRPLIADTYHAVERNVYDPDFKDIFHGTWSPRFKRHGVYMITLPTAALSGEVLGQDRVRPLVDHCLHEILHVFAKDEHQALFESVGRDGSVIDDDEGRVLNPGHALESMWFAIEEGKRRGDRAVVDRAMTIADWMYQRGYDREHGGIVAFLDSGGQEPRQMDWHKETGMRWCDKPWWVHSEALYCLALCAVEAQSPAMFERFLDLHAWCQAHFYDAEYGEWYAELYRDGSVKLTDKGTLWKAAYHLPRALLKISKLFERPAP